MLKILKNPDNHSAIVSNFTVSAKNEEIMSHSGNLAGVYPTASFYVKNLKIINSLSFSEQLADFCNVSVEETFAISKKAGV